LVLTLAGCGDNQFHQSWHDTKLPSGKTVKVTQFLLAWGVEHDERHPDQDCFAMEFVYTQPDASDEAHGQEAREVFELMRTTSELWNLNTATVAGFPKTERKGKYDLYIFTRGADGQWAVKREQRKVFAND
ncbi:MAG TPA: hypothetical protein VFJ90_07000, partial [Candidatus Didemnitutus sp.]|nr:hypothetical protein [Candidatus Didemnitutus sp.]